MARDPDQIVLLLRDLEAWSGRLGWRWLSSRDLGVSEVRLLGPEDLRLGRVASYGSPGDPWGWSFAGGVPSGSRETSDEASLALLSRRLVAWLNSLEGWSARYGTGSLEVRGPGGFEASALAGGSNLWSVAGCGEALAGLEPDEAVAEVALRSLRAADEAGAVPGEPPGIFPADDPEVDLALLERARAEVERLG